VEGTAEKRKSPNNEKYDTTLTTSSNKSNSNSKAAPPLLDAWSKLFSSFIQQSQASQSSLLLLQCPCEIVATVAGGGLYINKKKVLDLPFIQGTGLVRVLYADPNLRIFESPYENNGGWEGQGLIVVQVRQTLLS
jgi:hypothetical protein